MFKAITKSELNRLLKTKKNFKIVDVTPRSRGARTLGVPQALFLPEEILEQNATKILKKHELIVVCYIDKHIQTQDGQRATDKLLSLGYKHVIEYFG